MGTVSRGAKLVRCDPKALGRYFNLRLWSGLMGSRMELMGWIVVERPCATSSRFLIITEGL